MTTDTAATDLSDGRELERLLHDIVDHLAELDGRIRTLEERIALAEREPEPVLSGAASIIADDIIADDLIADDLATIGASLDSVIASLDATGADSSWTTDTDEASRARAVATDDSPRRPAWRTPNTRPAGWQPVSRRAC